MRLAAFFVACALALFAGPAWAACSLGSTGAAARVAIGATGRTALIHIPAGATGKPLPLVLLFHGSGGNGADMLQDSGLSTTADRHGFIVVAPDAGIPAREGFAWNIPGVPTVTGHLPTAADPNDELFVMQTIDWLVLKGCADGRRVYATGLSGGGRMTSWLACSAPGRFAAVAPVVGLRAGNPLASDPQRPDPATCRPRRAVPVMAFSGDADTVNPVEGGGAPYWQYPVSAALARWAALDGCRNGPAVYALSPVRAETRWTGCRGGSEVISHMLTGGEHVWVADNEAMWAFFARHRR